MFFTLSKILWWVGRPSSLLVLVLVIGLIASLIRSGRLGRWLMALATLGFLAVAAFPVDSWVLGPLEQRFPAVREMPKHLDGVIVLGGAVELGLSVLHGMPSLNDAAERMTVFVQLAHDYPDAKLVFTGGSPELNPNSPREADFARQWLAEMGIDTSRVIFERDSRNTYENAVFTKRLVNPQPGETWALVTSASHMPRSVGIFRKVGWQVLPWPVGYKVHNADPADDFGLKLTHLDWGAHEWIGPLAYHLAGRTDAWFPAPGPSGP
jgi:uncharacterized SAM-binding protein YcdF (DUF218 family)